MLEELLWTEKYRPHQIADTILSEDLKKTFQQFVDNKDVPNLLLTGKPGVGKTTVAKAMLDEIGADYIVINGSLNGNIDTLRNEIQSFASTVSFSGGRKVVIIDEADYLNPQSTQPALRGFIEEFSKNCGFIFTCNFKNRMIDALLSRVSIVEFKIKNTDKPKLAMEFLKRVEFVLNTEKVEFDKKIVAQLIMTHFPDFRRVLNELQRYAASGKIDGGILKNISEESFKALVGHMKNKSFSETRKWITDNSDIDPIMVMRNLYDTAYDHLTTASIPPIILILADYQYKHAFAADPEINLAACLIEVMVSASWK